MKIESERPLSQRDGDSLHVSVTVDEEDFRPFHEYMTRLHSGSFEGYYWLGILWVVAAAGFAFVVVAASGQEMNWFSFFLGAFCAGTFCVCLYARFRRAHVALNREDIQVYLGPQWFRLTRAAFEHGTTDVQSATSWQIIFDVIEAPDHIFVLLGRTYGHVIPKRGFEDAAQSREFFETARSFLSQAAGDRGTEHPVALR